eukprot:CAMPEP_0198330470 /NCGR_PEP_ID=MMETSP1450-20131203/16925_1 /TAXON_ID=753684 ORGANISM="Madagascaria erythrocladiodes, Strain CCMP3234" /NCGR_SAMPLE_ID=MMETSP1450 /ASSEMBLY_ACC=CAM_ASM_001115 /LENGTH=133 /DNA_ID=CAMNT_0044034765 /DNA_START=56 /DNA_END=457 /DNA_ORIENTATION=+
MPRAATKSKSGKGKGTAPKAKKVRYVIDCSKPVDDGILSTASFETFLKDKIKVNGKAGVLGDAVKVRREKNKIIIIAEEPFSKRYLKYLTKKYLKKHQIRDWLHVVATDKYTYQLKYFNIQDDDDDDGGDDDE